MPEINEVYQNTTSFNDVTWETDNIFIADCTSISFFVHCSVDCVMSLKWKIDDNSDFLIETKTVLANTGTLIYSPVKTRNVVFSVGTFNSLPCDLKTSGFFFI